MNDEKDEEYIDLLYLAQLFLRNWFSILLCALLFGAIAFGYTYRFITPMYKSSTLLYINNSSFSLGSTSISLADLNSSKSLVDTYIVIMKARTTVNEVMRRANLKYSYEHLRDMLSASAVNGTQIMEVTVTGPDPEENTVIANTMAEVLPEIVYDITDGSAVRIVDYAVVPARRSSPNIQKNILVGLLAGIVIRCFFIVVADFRNDQIEDSNFLSDTYSHPVLAVIPDLRMRSAGKGNYGYYYQDPAQKKSRGKTG